MTDYAGIHCCVGVSGAGKTYTVRSDVHRAAGAMPVVVFDQMEEWSDVPSADLKALSAGVVTRGVGLEAALKTVKDHIAAGKRLIIVRTTGLDETVRGADLLCRYAIEEKPKDMPFGIAFPEAHVIAPAVGRVPQYVLEVARKWRHRSIALWCDTQRLAALSKAILENSRDVKLFAMVGHRDYQTLLEMGDRELVDAVRECAIRFDAGDPGWHVALRASRMPPYELRKEGASE